MVKRLYHIFGACSCWGAQIRNCEKGPLEFIESEDFKDLLEELNTIKRVELLYPLKGADEEVESCDVPHLIHDFNLRLGTAVIEGIEKGHFPVVIGGDHSIAVGTWSGVRIALLKKSPLPLGLLWIDAHLDSHTTETSPSGAYHGMPLAGLLGFGDKTLSCLLQQAPVLLPQHVVIIGTRSFEEAELKLLQKLQVKIYDCEEVKRKGLQVVMQEAIQIASKGTYGFGVSLDLDVLDPNEAPGVGSQAPQGITRKELLKALPLITKNPHFVGVEIVEFNPSRDVLHKTRNLEYEIFRKIIT